MTDLVKVLVGLLNQSIPSILTFQVLYHYLELIKLLDKVFSGIKKSKKRINPHQK